MKFSTRAEYGLQAMANLARHYPAQKNIRQISKEEGIPAKYLERLMGELRKNILVQSFQGKNGGYVLIKNPKLIKVGQIIEILEGSLSPMGCADSRCRAACSCSSSLVWLKLGKQIRKTLYGIRLSELIK
ncbi:Rrf2 family transcriptional regulator [Patescibacteria group bacterium]|nr:Rrf2 family transcriptional regulator [Patescibacteria group bacterium]